MPSLSINGGNVVYEILGDSGDFIVLTPVAGSARTFRACAVGAGAGRRRPPRPVVGPAELRRVRCAVLRSDRIPLCAPRPWPAC